MGGDIYGLVMLKTSPLKHFNCIPFPHVSSRYRPDMPLVLKGVSFSVRPGEKVGPSDPQSRSLLLLLLPMASLPPTLT